MSCAALTCRLHFFSKSHWGGVGGCVLCLHGGRQDSQTVNSTKFKRTVQRFTVKSAIVKTSQLSFRTSHHPQSPLRPTLPGTGDQEPLPPSLTRSVHWPQQTRAACDLLRPAPPTSFQVHPVGPGSLPGVAGPRLFSSHHLRDVWTAPTG